MSVVSDQERRVDVFFLHRVVEILSLGPRFQRILLHKFLILVYLCRLATNLLVRVLEEEEVAWEVYVCMASWNQISVLMRSTFDFLADKWGIGAPHTLFWHYK